VIKEPLQLSQSQRANQASILSFNSLEQHKNNDFSKEKLIKQTSRRSACILYGKALEYSNGYAGVGRIKNITEKQLTSTLIAYIKLE
jgi:hypothetical protein